MKKTWSEIAVVASEVQHDAAVGITRMVIGHQGGDPIVLTMSSKCLFDLAGRILGACGASDPGRVAPFLRMLASGLEGEGGDRSLSLPGMGPAAPVPIERRSDLDHLIDRAVAIQSAARSRGICDAVAGAVAGVALAALADRPSIDSDVSRAVEIGRISDGSIVVHDSEADFAVIASSGSVLISRMGDSSDGDPLAVVSAPVARALGVSLVAASALSSISPSESVADPTPAEEVGK